MDNARQSGQWEVLGQSFLEFEKLVPWLFYSPQKFNRWLIFALDTCIYEELLAMFSTSKKNRTGPLVDY